MDSPVIVILSVCGVTVQISLLGYRALARISPRGVVLVVGFLIRGIGNLLAIGEFERTFPLQLCIIALKLAGTIGMIYGVIDLFRRRKVREHSKNTVAATNKDDSALSHLISLCEWILRSPLTWGGLACMAYYALLNQGVISSPLLARYTWAHPVEIVEVAFFFIGLAALFIRLSDIGPQFRSIGYVSLGPMPVGGQRIQDCDSLLESLATFPRRIQKAYLVRRLRAALQFVSRKGSADDLDQHLRHLEELDALQMHSGYATLRIIIWAIPILGFLGTVIGITVAIANLSPDALEQSMNEVTLGLGVAFDTTAEALALTMVLMFAKALVERVENGLLSGVDARVSEELVGRFQESAVADDPNVTAVRRMSEHVLEAVEALASRQAEVWKSAIQETHQQWADVSMAAGHIVKDSLSTAIKDNLEQHARVLGQNALKHADQLSVSAGRHIDKLDHSSQETVGRLREGLEKLAELLVEALERHGDVLTKSEKELAKENRQHLSEVEAALGNAMVTSADRQENLIKQSEHLLKEMQVALVEAAGATVRQQEQLIRQSDVLLKVVDSTGQIKKLEESLNQNLAAVQQSHNFEEMALNLSAAIQLLGARLGHYPPAARSRDIAGDESPSQAA